MSTLNISAAAYAEIQAKLKELALEANILPGSLDMTGIVLVWNGEPNCSVPLFAGPAIGGLNVPGEYPIG